MLVAFDHQIFSTQRRGGITRYFVELARHIPSESQSKAKTKIIAPFYKNQFLYESRRELKFNGLLIPDIPRTGRLFRHANDSVSSFLLRLAAPDVVHETYYASEMIGPKKPARVLTVYDMIHEIFPDQFSKKNIARDAKKRAVARADHVICISENTRGDLINILNIERERTSVVHLGFALNVKESSAEILRGRPFLFYIGSRGGYKNFSNFAEAYASSSTLSNLFDLVCFGGGYFREGEINLFRKLKVSPGKIHYVSGDDDLLSEYYKNASLFVYPSLYEGFGIPPLEAMSYGCPVVCSNTSSIPEIVGDAAVFFDPYSIESIQSAIDTVLFDSSVRTLLIQKGYDRIHHFSWEQCARETLNVYEGLLP